MPNIIEAIQERCNYIRETILPEYEKVGAAGAIGGLLLKQQVQRAEAVIASGDPIVMIATLKELRETCERAL